MNSITEGILPEDLKTFLVHLGVKKLVLGVAESKLAAAISECFPKFKVKIGEVILEITRGLRTHFYKMVKGFTAEAGKHLLEIGLDSELLLIFYPNFFQEAKHNLD